MKAKSLPPAIQEIANFYYPNPIVLTLSEFKDFFLIPMAELGAKKFLKELQRRKY